MSQRTALLILLFPLAGLAQVRLEKGEHLLRGVFHASPHSYQLILNNNTRAMTVLDLNAKDAKTLAAYPSGTNIEVCTQVTSNKQSPNFSSQLIKIRPLGPKEPLIFYSGKLTGCQKNKGCTHFDKPFKAPAFGNIMMADLPKDYLVCQ